jgi:16S rRNA (adenine1518-N6/adenine1519-N6)-dimethyltransferase
MIQKEVAERIDAEPNCKEYGALSVLVQYYCNTSIIRRVPPTCFIPRPKVDSIVIKLDRLNEPRVKVKDVNLMFELVRAGFNMRRKTLWNAAKTLKVEKTKLEESFEKSAIDPKRRAETLSLEEFGVLSDCIYDVKSEN